jgi:hypothetical protein
MKERPIMFSAPMVRAILDGRKTMTRRVFKDAIDKRTKELPGAVFKDGSGKGWVAWFPGTGMTAEKTARAYPGEDGFKCPYGQPGDRLWVRHAWYHHEPPSTNPGNEHAWDEITMTARWISGDTVPNCRPKLDPGYKRRPSIFMPRWASLITLEITDVSVERLQEISEDDAFAEGVAEKVSPEEEDYTLSAEEVFHKLWDSINGKTYPWESNPWVWAIEFKKLSE